MAGLTAGKLLAGNMVLGITGTGQGGGIALSSIIVTTPPTKTQYAQAESFNPTGMVVTAIYSNGATRIVTDYTVSPTFFSGGERAVTISYTENGVITTVQQAVVVHTPTNDELYRAAITQVLVDEKIRLDDVTDSLNLFMEICTSFVDTDEDGTTYHLLHPDAAAVLVSWRLGYDGLEDIITDETRYIETILESFQESDLSALEFHSGWDGSLTGRYGLTAIGLAQSAIQSNIESSFGNPYIKNAIQMGKPVMTGSDNHANFRSDQVSKQLYSSNFLYFSPADN